MIDFQPFPKIPRLRRRVVVTEKIDGTNACVWVDDTATIVRAGSRNKWIDPKADNYGFAGWVEKNAAELLRLGPGFHYGEWWGAGIQRRYDLSEKRFSLFNVGRWNDAATARRAARSCLSSRRASVTPAWRVPSRRSGRAGRLLRGASCARRA